ncbi:hypothetical protein MTP03_26270 [Tsukamurella sp. PLM1]|nr:hypothetical protein MTP03_26270 [Tsukamurella sp. PLM1]
MYPAMLAAFDAFHRIWDPSGLLNPASIVDPDPVDANLALDGVPDRPWPTHVRLPAHGSGVDPFVHAVQGCIGVGKCRSAAGGVMCPSYRATGDETDSTRGRARALQEMVRSSATVAEGWRSETVREALDLCLSCRACSTDCPTGVDMATYKSEFLAHYYDGRLRPVSHYTLGRLPVWLKLAGFAAPVANAVLRTPLSRLITALGGVSRERVLPRFASRRAWRREVAAALSDGAPPRGPRVVLFADTFTRGLRPAVAGAAARVLDRAGRRVECSADVCCGLTWISTGQLAIAAKRLAGAAAALDDGTADPIVVIEPSCAAALRKDLPDLVPTDAARRVAARVHTFASYADAMLREGWRPAPASGVPYEVVLQTHCHEYAVFGAGAHRRILEAAGTTVRDATGCCGVAGNFGFERRHFDVSMKVAEQARPGAQVRAGRRRGPHGRVLVRDAGGATRRGAGETPRGAARPKHTIAARRPEPVTSRRAARAARS